MKKKKKKKKRFMTSGHDSDLSSSTLVVIRLTKLTHQLPILQDISFIVDRQAKVLGVDTPSIDVSTSLHRPVHVLLLGNNIPVLEYAANLDSIPPSGTTIFLGAIKTRGGSGGAVRAIAILDDAIHESAATRSLISILLIVLLQSLLYL